jgi:hypothetical protein
VSETWDDLLTQQHGIFTKQQATEHGITAQLLADRIREGLYRKVAPDTFYAGGAAELPDQAREWRALLSLNVATLSHETAAGHWRLKVPLPKDIHVTVAHEDWRQRAGVVAHRSKHLGDDDVTERHGLRMTTLERTIVDLFETLDRRDDRRAMVADAFRRRRTTAPRIFEVVQRIPQLRRRGELFYTVALAASGSHSVGEMRLYEFMVAWNLPTPERQVMPELPRGRRYLDCALLTYKIVLEYDGDLHLTDKQKHDDIMRDQQLRRLGWHTIRVTELRMRDERQLAEDIWLDIVERAEALGVSAPDEPKCLTGQDDQACTIRMIV